MGNSAPLGWIYGVDLRKELGYKHAGKSGLGLFAETLDISARYAVGLRVFTDYQAAQRFGKETRFRPLTVYTHVEAEKIRAAFRVRGGRYHVTKRKDRLDDLDRRLTALEDRLKGFK